MSASAVRKVRALLRLADPARGGAPAEREAARAKAQALAAKHAIALEALTGLPEDRELGEHPVSIAGTHRVCDCAGPCRRTLARPCGARDRRRRSLTSPVVGLPEVVTEQDLDRRRARHPRDFNLTRSSAANRWRPASGVGSPAVSYPSEWSAAPAEAERTALETAGVPVGEVGWLDFVAWTTRVNRLVPADAQLGNADPIVHYHPQDFMAWINQRTWASEWPKYRITDPRPDRPRPRPR